MHVSQIRSQISKNQQFTVFIRIKAGLIYMQGLKYTPGSVAE